MQSTTRRILSVKLILALAIIPVQAAMAKGPPVGVVDAGCITEHGRHDALVRAGGLYATLYQAPVCAGAWRRARSGAGRCRRLIGSN